MTGSGCSWDWIRFAFRMTAGRRFRRTVTVAMVVATPGGKQRDVIWVHAPGESHQTH